MFDFFLIKTHNRVHLLLKIFFNGYGKAKTNKSAIVDLLFGQNVLQDMESKRPQLEQVLSTARDLQKQRMSEEDKKILKDRGEGSRPKVKTGTWSHYIKTNWTFVRLCLI